MYFLDFGEMSWHIMELKERVMGVPIYKSIAQEFWGQPGTCNWHLKG